MVLSGSLWTANSILLNKTSNLEKLQPWMLSLGTTRTPSLLMAKKEKKLAGAAEQEGLLVNAECGALLERK